MSLVVAGDAAFDVGYPMCRVERQPRLVQGFDSSMATHIPATYGQLKNRTQRFRVCRTKALV
jgi:hypothetical protein